MILVALMLAAVASAQSSITIYFAPSSVEVERQSICSVFQNFKVDSIVGYANSLPNLNGQSNEDLARQRVESVLAAVEGTDVEYSLFVDRRVVSSADAEYRKVVIYVSAKEGTPMAGAGGSVLTMADSVCTVPVVEEMEMASVEMANEVLRASAREFRTAEVEVVSPVAVNVSPRELVGEVLPKKVMTLYSLDAKDEMVQEMMREKMAEADNHIDRQQARAIGMTESKKLRRQMRFMLQMWIKYDAIPSCKMGREGARFGNGNSYRIAATWTPAGVSAKDDLIIKYGKDIPWLGWDRSAYAEYWSTHTVFGEVKDKNPLARKMSYSSKSSARAMRKLRSKKVKRKVIYFFRSLTACKRVGK